MEGEVVVVKAEVDMVVEVGWGGWLCWTMLELWHLAWWETGRSGSKFSKASL